MDIIMSRIPQQTKHSCTCAYVVYVFMLKAELRKKQLLRLIQRSFIYRITSVLCICVNSRVRDQLSCKQSSLETNQAENSRAMRVGQRNWVYATRLNSWDARKSKHIYDCLTPPGIGDVSFCRIPLSFSSFIVEQGFSPLWMFVGVVRLALSRFLAGAQVIAWPC